MARLLARYALLAVAVVLLNFLLPRLLPGDPLDQAGADGLNGASTGMTTAARERLRAMYHLDRPLLPDQLLAYLGDLSRGDLGWSIARAAPVAQLVGERLPWTLALVLPAVLVGGGAGTLLGLAVAYRGGRLDHAALGAATVLAAVPEFLLAMTLVLLLGVGAGWFPLHGGQGALAPLHDPLGVLLDVAWHLVLPSLTLLLANAASFVLLTRGAVAAVLSAPYLTTARAKGLSEWFIALRHAAPNALTPVLTLLGLRVGSVLGGTVVVERVFAVPGLGLLASESIAARDYPVLQAVFLLGSFGMLAAGLVLDVTYRHLPGSRARAPG